MLAIIGSGLDVLGALPKYVTRPSWQEVVASLEQVAWVIQVMVREVAYWGSTVAGDLQSAAKAFAENAGPVVGLISGGLEAIAALREFKGLAIGDIVIIVNNMSTLNRFLATLVADLAKVAGVVKEDMQDAARTFAENAVPVIDIIVGGLEAIAALGKFTAWDWPTLLNALDNMSLLDRFLGSLVADMGKVGARITIELQGAAKLFAESAKPVIEIIAGGLAAITELGKFEAWDWPMLLNALDKMSLLDRLLGSLLRIWGRLGQRYQH